jgi:hypothetical protein
MFDFPTQDYAIKYCNDNSLVLGCRYFIVDLSYQSVYIITDTSKVKLGKIFFEQYFKIDLRTINLEKLI